MAPRAYSMERRSAHIAATRERVLDAAMAAYAARGIRATSMTDVARAADVAPGTVLNHFPTADALVTAVLERITRSLEPPDARIFRGARSRGVRVRRLVDGLFAFYDRGNPWFAILRGEFDEVPALRAAEAAVWASVEPLYGQALGSVAADDLIRGAVLGLTSPATLGALREAGLSLDDASRVVGDALVDLVDAAQQRTTVG